MCACVHVCMYVCVDLHSATSKPSPIDFSSPNAITTPALVHASAIELVLFSIVRALRVSFVRYVYCSCVTCIAMRDDVSYHIDLNVVCR